MTSNNNSVLRSSTPNPIIPQLGNDRNPPALPPRPSGTSGFTNNLSLYSPYQAAYSNFGYSSIGNLPYRNSLHGSFGYNSFGSYNSFLDNYNTLGPRDDAERRFIQFAEEHSRSTFANIESIVRTVNSISTMLDNTFFAMVSSFRAILSVAESFGHMRNMFGHIWYSISLYRFFKWLYKKLLMFLGYKTAEAAVHHAWNEAHTNAVTGTDCVSRNSSSSWPTLAFFGILMSAPYFISKFFLPKYEDRHNPEKWKHPGIRAKAAFDFVATNPNEMNLKTNDEIFLAPTYIQEEMKLTNSGWAFAVGNGKSGLVPLNFIVFLKKNNGVLKSRDDKDVPNPRVFPKKVTFGENEIIETNTTEPVTAISQAQKASNNNNYLNNRYITTECKDNKTAKCECNSDKE